MTAVTDSVYRSAPKYNTFLWMNMRGLSTDAFAPNSAPRSRGSAGKAMLRMQ